MGALFCLLSAAAFGAMAVFGKLSYDEGVSVDALLLVRFGLAGLVLMAIAVARGAFRGIPRRAVLVSLGMGVFGYAAQAGLYFSALTRIDASLVALLLYLYPILVMAGAILLGREGTSRRRVWALGLALGGIILVLSGAASGRFDLTGALLAASAAVVYTCYILVGDRTTADVPPLALTALVCTGAFGTFLVATLIRGTAGQLTTITGAGWFWLAVLSLVSTVAAILLFFAGMARVGPSVASILSILEPVVTVVSAALVFGEHLTPIQCIGGAIVLSAVLIVQWPTRATDPSGLGRKTGGTPLLGGPPPPSNHPRRRPPTPDPAQTTAVGG
ncbi:DMT family transporter [Kribbella albertanoniae]|uniref:DMT family transporter n=1 Tax=Kribbella albertanoniae TaxID=1266829 RepID=A0A4V2XMH2_9ACTN|nr:DMT family transporter [Kribbella albertanoniae]